MAKQVQMTFWNYNSFKDYKPHMLRDWIELGINLPLLPKFNMEKDSKEDLIAILDDAQSLGVQVLLQFDSMFVDSIRDFDAYRVEVQKICDTFGSHPAVYGYYVGEEPNVGSQEAYFECTKIIKEISPNAAIYTNFGSIERTERMMLQGNQKLEDWIEKFHDYSGNDIVGYGCYSGLFRDNSGSFEHFYNLNTFVEASKKHGVDVWATMLSSAHDFYRVPTEDDYRWQINTCVACGCRGIVWFRLYDKLVAADYRGSPIDEFGVKTQHFYDMARAQKKFNIHYGKLFGRLNHVSTHGIGVSYGGYPYFVPSTTDEAGAVTDLISHADCRAGLISFFKDEDGTDYIAVVNTDTVNSYHMTLTYSAKVERADMVYYDEKQLNCHVNRNGQEGDLRGQSFCLAPGQMEVIKVIRRK